MTACVQAMLARQRRECACLEATIVRGMVRKCVCRLNQRLPVCTRKLCPPPCMQETCSSPLCLCRKWCTYNACARTELRPASMNTVHVRREYGAYQGACTRTELRPASINTVRVRSMVHTKVLAHAQNCAQQARTQCLCGVRWIPRCLRTQGAAPSKHELARQPFHLESKRRGKAMCTVLYPDGALLKKCTEAASGSNLTPTVL